jgi:HD-like signal output (HDOD) protein
MVENVKERLERLDEIGTLPQVMARILAIVDDDNSTALDLASEIEHDQALTARILRTVNSSYYGFQRQIMTVPEAVVILGFNEVERLALAISVINTLGMDRENVVTLARLWKHSLATSMAGSQIETLRGHEPGGVEGAHVAGLLHCLGMVIISQAVPEAATPIHAYMRDHECGVIEAERVVLEGITHPEVGARVAEKWGLPEPLVNAIRYYAAPSESPAPTPLIHATHLAHHLANKANLGVTGIHDPFEPDPESVALLALDEHLESEIMRFLERNRSIMSAVSSAAMF